jgi:hypothetical protein
MSEANINFKISFDAKALELQCLYSLWLLYQADGAPYGLTEEGFFRWRSEIRSKMGTVRND